MKAIRIHEHGGVDALKWDDIPKPELSVNQVLIDVKATSLNHLDIWVRKGIPGVPLPLITGSDAAGIISGVGDGVKKSRIGEKVMIQP
ncbi:MAG: alcohol dehydrogenase catalytic domain-containing protein, partial [Fidelibacterota bacterium]